ncbi:hypothetical protein QF205_16265 [Luteimonas composti]|uniref:Uncharacterized protein n=1 Tax=Luteimonas composti TaxID=398257 RepID=A0ABT6MVI6_9GAMM|nr:hypothetical protein [Luteimonas composti]MDH7454613.1 hypothetical protein [Luteimonas composti]
MSSIGSTPPGFGTTGFPPAGQVSLDEARHLELLRGETAPAAADAPAAAALVDPGESVLALSAWDGVDAPRTLGRDADFSGRLAGMDRAEAANAGVDGILASL